MKPTSRCIQQCVTCGGVHGGGVVVVCVFTCYFTTYLPVDFTWTPGLDDQPFQRECGYEHESGGE